jgi:hypothetical protein
MKYKMQITLYKGDESSCQYLCAWRHFWNTLSLPPVGPHYFLFHIADALQEHVNVTHCYDCAF